MTRMPVKFFPSDFIYWKKVKNHENIKEKMMDHISKIKDRSNYSYDVRNGHTSFYNEEQEDNKFFAKDCFLIPVVFDTIREFVEIINKNDEFYHKLDFKDLTVTGCWYTKYDKNGSFDLHQHDQGPFERNGCIVYPIFSLIYILNDENSKNTTEFTSIGKKMSLHRDGEYVIDTGDIDDIKEGTVILFPSSLHHRVLQSEIPGRIAIAYNLAALY
jgi:hypothetical protein